MVGAFVILRPDPVALFGSAESTTRAIVKTIEETAEPIIKDSLTPPPSEPAPRAAAPTPRAANRAAATPPASRPARPAAAAKKPRKPSPPANAATATPKPVRPKPAKPAPSLPRRMYVAVEVANVRIDPSPNGQIIGTLARETPIEVLRSRNGWVNVKIPGIPGAAGWMLGSKLTSKAPSG